MSSTDENPPVRYDTTSKLTSAFDGHFSTTGDRPPRKGQNPPVRYDTTGVLTAGCRDCGGQYGDGQSGRKIRGDGRQRSLDKEQRKKISGGDQNPPVRYDTTGKLSSAFDGKFNEKGDLPPRGGANPPIRYDTTGSLTACHAARSKSHGKKYCACKRKGKRQKAAGEGTSIATASNFTRKSSKE